MKILKGTKTEDNLKTALAGESQARNHYDWFASVANKEGFVELSQLFTATALNEKEHAKLWAKALGQIGTTAENLASAAAGEHAEHTKMYKEFAETAKKEGFNELSVAFANVAKIEAHHEQRFLDFLNQLKSKQVFKKATSIKWECLNCGHIHEGAEAPQTCPTCAHPQSFFSPICTCGDCCFCNKK